MIVYFATEEITGISTDMTGDRARKIIEDCLATIRPDVDVEIAFFWG